MTRVSWTGCSARYRSPPPCSIFGLSAGRAALIAIIALAISAALLIIARPLLFASLDEDVAAAWGVPVRLLGYGFLVLVAGTAAESTQVVGALLILGLLAAPGRHRHPHHRAPLAWLGRLGRRRGGQRVDRLIASYLVPQLPASFAILTVATVAYLIAIAAGQLRRRRPAIVAPAADRDHNTTPASPAYPPDHRREAGNTLNPPAAPA